MQHIYSIYQAGIETPYKFRGFDFAKDFDLEGDYSKVYKSTINGDFESDIEILEELFRIFNIEYPSDFKGHSLSTSDVVILDSKIYYCDSFGWKLIK